MYATLIQSAPSTADVRQTVVIAHEGNALVYSRIAGKRGVAGAWEPGTPSLIPNERVLGTPVSTRLSSTDDEHLGSGVKPTVLLQRIQRLATDTSVSQDDAQSLIEATVAETVADPTSLAKYSGRRISVSPVVQVVSAPAPQPVVAPVITAPAPAPQPVALGQGLAPEFHPELYTPTREECSSYVERILGGVPETQFYSVLRRQGKSVGIWGHAGTGKTSSARHIASVWGVPLVTIECNLQTDEAIIQGEWIPTGDGTQLAWRWSPLAEALQFSPNGAVVLINEANRMSAKANAFFLRILQERRLQVTRYDNRDIVIGDNVLFIFDSNPGYAGTGKMDEALEDRFVTTTFTYDRAVESKFIKSSTLLDAVFKIRAQYDAREVRTLFTTRMVRDFQDIALDPEGGLGLAEFLLFDKFKNAVDLEAVKLVFELNRTAIARELGVTA